MSRGNSVEHIDAVDAFARTLFVRAKQSSAAFRDISDAVRPLHTALRHLRLEAADPDSPINEAVYAEQVWPLVEDCGFTLKQLEGSLDDDDRSSGSATADDSARRARLAPLLSKLRIDRTSIESFLDNVQLHNATSPPSMEVAVANSQQSLDDIKDKVNLVAGRMFNRRRNAFTGDDDGLWREFQMELEKEGFSSEVLQNHKEVLRAYIRGLEALASQTGGAPPTVQGLLEYETGARSSPPSPSSEKEVFTADIECEKYPASIKSTRRMPQDAPPPRPPKEPPIPPKEPLPELYQLMPRRQSSSMSTSSMSDRPPLPPRDSSNVSMALISTKDLVDMDSLNHDMSGLQLQRRALPPYEASSPTRNHKYLTYNHPHALPAPPDAAEMSGSPDARRYAASPRTNLAGPAHALPNSPPPPYAGPTQMHHNGPRPAARRPLGPDSTGRQIPMEAQWTKINRDLVSPEVLEKAGVRYEARPTFVAILGRLNREDIADFARKTADCRAARALRARQQQQQQQYQNGRQRPLFAHERTDSKSSRDDEDDDDGSSTFSSDSDTTDFDDDKMSDKGTKSYPFIVSPPQTERASPASTVPPKSILKKRVENHVRFSPDTYESSGRSPRSYPRDDRDRRSNSDRPSSRRYRTEDDWDRDRRDRSRRYADDDDRRRRRTHDGDYYYSSGHRSSGQRRSHHRERDRDRRGGGNDRVERAAKKKAWGETLGAVGIGSAAASLLGVLVEAAAVI